MFYIERTTSFNKRMKTILKKYPSCQDDFYKVIESIEQSDYNNLPGKVYNNIGLPIGEKVMKLRVQNLQSKEGKRGGFRIIYYANEQKQYVHLMFIFSKSELENIKASEIQKTLKTIR